jgi:hypothetical protein
MNQVLADELMDRVQSLERQLRRQRRFLAVTIAVAILAGVGIAAEPSGDIRAKSFTLSDGDGKIRATIGLDDIGGVAFSTFSRTGALAASLGDNAKRGAYVGLYGTKNGEPNVRAYMMLSDGEPSLLLRGKSGKTLFAAP